MKVRFRHCFLFRCLALVVIVSLAILNATDSAAGRSVAGSPQNPAASAHYSAGTQYMGRGQYALAIAELNKAMQIEPTAASAHLNLGIAYYHHGSYERALASLQASYRLNPDYPITRFQLGNAFYAVQRFEEAAEEYYMAALSRVFRPPYVTFILQALALLRASDVEAAQRVLRGSLGRRGKWVAAYLLGDMSEEKFLAKVRKKKEDDRLFAYLVIGVNSIVKNDIPKAQKSLQTVMDESNPTWLYYVWARVNLEQMRR